MVCPYCGYALEEDDQYCPDCGEKVENKFIDSDDNDDEIFKEENGFMIFMHGVLSGLDFLWRALIRPDQSLSRDKTPWYISISTVAVLLLISAGMLYFFFEGREEVSVNLLYGLELFAVFLMMLALSFGVIFIITKALISREVTTYRMIQDFSTLSVHLNVFFMLGVGALYFGVTEAFLILLVIVFALLIVNPVVLVMKYMMTHKAKIGLYFTSLLTVLLNMIVLLLLFYLSLHEVAFQLIEIL